MKIPSRCSHRSFRVSGSGKFSKAAIMTVVSVALSSWVSAASNTWDGGGGDALWTNAVNWAGDTNVPGGASGTTNADIATFSNNTNTSVTVDGARNLKSITFDTGAGAFTLQNGGLVLTTGGAITMNAGVTTTQTINTAITLSSGANSTYAFTNNSGTVGASLVIGGNVTGATTATVSTLTLGGSNNGSIGGIIGDGAAGGTVKVSKSGVGVWTLSGGNTFSGGTAIAAGTLIVKSASALGTTGSAVSLTSGATLYYAADSAVNAYALSLPAAGGGSHNIVVDRATAGTAVNQSFTSVLFSGATSGGGDTLNATIGTNVTSGTPVLTIGSITGVTSGAIAHLAGNVSYNIGSMTGASVATAATATFILEATSTGNVITGAITDNNTGAALNKTAVTLSSGGAWTLSGANTYTGATSVNLGKLTLNGATGSLGATTVLVASGNTPSATVGNATLVISGDYTIGTATAGSLTVSAGNTGVTPLGQGTLSLVDGTVNTLTLANNTAAATTFTIGRDTLSGNNSILNMEVGSVSDKIALASAAKIKIGTNGTATVVNVTGLGGLTGATQTLIDAAGGIATGSFASFTLGTTSGNFGGRTVSLGSTATSLTLIESAAAAAPATAYWKGTNDGVWTSFTGGNSNITNWATDAAGTNSTQIPDGNSNVIFSVTGGGSNLTTTLGQDYAINSLTFGAAADVAHQVGIGGTNTLTINAAAVNGNTSGNGIMVSAGSGNHTISSKVALGASQAWTVTDAGTTLVASNQISGGFALTKAGAGTLLLSGANTYTGGTTVTGGTLLVNNLTGSGTGTGALVIDAAATLGGSGNISGATTINGTLAPGNGSGVLSFGSTLTLAGATHMEIAGTARGTTYDGVNVSGGLTYGGTLTITFATTVSDGNTFDLFAAADGVSAPSGHSGSFSSVSVAGTYLDTLTNNSGVWTGSVDGFDFTFTEATGDLVIAATAIPEASTCAILVGAVSLVFSLSIRRRVRRE